jgi:hypothetical protein
MGLIRQLQLTEAAQNLDISIIATYSGAKPSPELSVVSQGAQWSGIEAQEVFKKIQTSRSIIFHNSPQNELARLRYREGFGQLRELSGESAKALEKLKLNMDRGLQKIAKSQQQELEGLLGRLETKYRVGLSVTAFDLGWLPFNLTLGDSKHDVPLDNWGSGTQNRTLILRALFRAKQIGDAEASAGKVTPIIIIEEPESFLHPYAQAEFGRVLQDLAEELGVQVLVTTHSPYLLSLNRPESNILLGRRAHYGRLRETQRIDSSGENWMAPFGQALGMNSEEFRPWHALFGSNSDAILLVEGDTDREYFELLRHESHGDKGLRFEGDVIAYDGVGSSHYETPTLLTVAAAGRRLRCCRSHGFEPRRRQGDAAAAFQSGQSERYPLVPRRLALCAASVSVRGGCPFRAQFRAPARLDSAWRSWPGCSRWTWRRRDVESFPRRGPHRRRAYAEEVLRRWTMVFAGPLLVQRYLADPDSLGVAETAAVLDPTGLADLSWYMRVLNESIARMANAEDGVTAGSGSGSEPGAAGRRGGADRDGVCRPEPDPGEAGRDAGNL